jgi:hypothetical protein
MESPQAKRGGLRSRCVGEGLRCEHPQEVGGLFSDGEVSVSQERHDGGYGRECERVECGYPFNYLSSHFGFRDSKCLDEERQGCFWLCKFQPSQRAGGRNGDGVVIIKQLPNERWAQRVQNGLVMLDGDVMEGLEANVWWPIGEDQAESVGRDVGAPVQYPYGALGCFCLCFVAGKRRQIGIGGCGCLPQSYEGVNCAFGSDCCSVGSQEPWNEVARKRKSAEFSECGGGVLFPGRGFVLNVVKEVWKCVGADLADGLPCLMLGGLVDRGIEPGAERATVVLRLGAEKRYPDETGCQDGRENGGEKQSALPHMGNVA